MLGDDGVGPRGAVEAAAWTADADGHATIDGFDIKFETGAALTFEFDFHEVDWVAGLKPERHFIRNGRNGRESTGGE